MIIRTSKSNNNESLLNEALSIRQVSNNPNNESFSPQREIKIVTPDVKLSEALPEVKTSNLRVVEPAPKVEEKPVLKRNSIDIKRLMLESRGSSPADNFQSDYSQIIDIRDGPSPISQSSPNIPLNPDTKIKIIKKTDLDKFEKVNSTAMQTERMSSEVSLRL
jgi:hypothetical protein